MEDVAQWKSVLVAVGSYLLVNMDVQLIPSSQAPMGNYARINHRIVGIQMNNQIGANYLRAGTPCADLKIRFPFDVYEKLNGSFSRCDFSPVSNPALSLSKRKIVKCYEESGK